MKKNCKIYLNFERDSLPNNFYTLLRSADENDLKIMLAVAFSGKDEIEKEVLCRELDMEENEFDASVKYWCGAGLLRKGKRAQPKQGSEPSELKKNEVSSSAHKNGKIERAGSELPAYTSTELAELIENRRITAEFINEAQRVFGKVFNTHEVNILVGLVDYIGFDEASVIILLSHVAKREKKSLRYVEKMAFALYDEGITDADSLQERLCKMEEYSKTEGEVKAMFGIVGRAATSKEKKFLSAWIETMGYGTEEIRLAYDITVDNTHSPSSAYANTILEAWYAAGLHTCKEIINYEEGKKGAQGKNNPIKSYNTDEFFNAAIKRTFDEL